MSSRGSKISTLSTPVLFVSLQRVSGLIRVSVLVFGSGTETKVTEKMMMRPGRPRTRREVKWNTR